MSSSDLLVFSEAQQQAVIGHMLQQNKIWYILQDIGIDEKWLVTNTLVDCFVQLKKFFAEFKRFPASINEISDFITDPLLNKSIVKTLQECVTLKGKHPWDVLEKKLVGWAKSRHVFTTTKDLAQKYNEGKHEEVYKIWQQGADTLQKIDAIVGLEPDGFISSAERVKSESQDRQADVGRIIKYAFPYLQDAIGGILPTDVVLWGATSGAGKTEAAKIQAAFTAKTTKKPVHYFALEAETNEIERRIKYGWLGSLYRQDHPNVPPGMVSYKNFRLNRLDAEFAPYEKKVNEIFEKEYNTLYTYYRKRSDFGLKELNREIFKLKGRSSLIILDHIHFVDMETSDENKEMKELIKSIKGIASTLEIPIMCVAHINKQGFRNQLLIPSKEDFHGSSDLYKISTACVMMAPASGLVSSDARAYGKPTFFRVVKARIDNGLDFTPGVCFYNPWTADYTEYYSAGRLEKGGRKWTSIKGDLPYWVDIEKNIVDVSDIE